ncbi:HNH endonuclease [Motilibacter peucedani]|uniref:HNH endonuclease n=1 Tax=Motilibacter peucedani TaxID=598650 RepID=A0A420XMR6_9ACTN|nr:HNH endonuclease [Motilibacter peucedani]
MRAELDAVEAAALAEVDSREAYRLDAAPTTKAWLRHHLRLDQGEAGTRLARAETLGALPRTADALRTGQISARHVDALTRGRRKLGVPTMAAAEETLLGLACTSSPEQVRLAVDRLVQVVDPDETATERAERQRASRHLHVAPGFDGTWTVTGLLDPADGALVKAAVDAHSRRRPLPDGSPDERTRGQRMADALVEFAAAALAAGDAPTVGGTTAHVTLVLDLETLRAEAAGASSAGAGAGAGAAGAAARGLVAGGLASVLGRSFGQAALERLTCSCDVTPVLIDDLGVPLAVGRDSRLAGPAHVKGLWVRDGGCITPGCEGRTVQAHHVVHWGHGGPTELPNLCLLCERCHHLVHDDGWVIEPDPRRPGLFQIRSPRGGPPVPAKHAVDRNPGATTPLLFDDPT